MEKPDKNLVIDLNANPMHNPNDSPTSMMMHTQPDELIQELNRMKWENKKLNEILEIVCRNYHDLMNRDVDEELISSRKRKSDEIDNGFIHSCCGGSPKEIKSNVSRVHVQIDPTDTSLIVKDGYQWRKYGQKVTRDNPSPRAYYKCSLAPTCPVKKKVQRSANDPSLLVATYDGQHNHPTGAEIMAALPPGGANLSPVACSGGTASNCDLKNPILCNRIRSAIATKENTVIQQLLVEQMASSLTRNRSFTDALAAAITGRILDDVSEGNGDSFSNSRVLQE